MQLESPHMYGPAPFILEKRAERSEVWLSNIWLMQCLEKSRSAQISFLLNWGASGSKESEIVRTTSCICETCCKIFQESKSQKAANINAIKWPVHSIILQGLVVETLGLFLTCFLPVRTTSPCHRWRLRKGSYWISETRNIVLLFTNSTWTSSSLSNSSGLLTFCW